MIKRSWDDNKKRNTKKGPFSENEIKKLEQKITDFCE